MVKRMPWVKLFYGDEGETVRRARGGPDPREIVDECESGKVRDVETHVDRR